MNESAAWGPVERCSVHGTRYVESCGECRHLAGELPAAKEPPEMMTLLWCSVCGRTDRLASFTGKLHFIGGACCPGTLVRLSYRLWEDNRVEP